MPEFKATGEVDYGKKETSLEKTVEAESRKHAESKIYAEIGSKHGVTRGKITIDNLEEIE
ncbi:MAG: ribosomal protein L20A (L18A) [Candidatus Nanohaloarchaea archaeon]|jgi:ribosomal protein L20A (L18A)